MCSRLLGYCGQSSTYYYIPGCDIVTNYSTRSLQPDGEIETATKIA